MMTTDMAFEFGKVLFREGWERTDISRIFDITAGNLSRLLHNELPTRKLVEILDTMGYDVEVRFVKQGEAGKKDE